MPTWEGRSKNRSMDSFAVGDDDDAVGCVVF